MLSTPAPFPHVGSFALYIDDDRPMPRAELVRVMAYPQNVRGTFEEGHGAIASIAFPNRIGSSGNKLVALDTLIDATPLSKDEERELTDGLRDLRGRVVEPAPGGRSQRSTELSRRLRGVKTRTDALRSRQLSSIILVAELKIMRSKIDRQSRRAGATTGRMMLDDFEYGPSGGRTERRNGRNITGEAA